MIIDTHCHFDMMDAPEQYIANKETTGDIVIGMTNLPSHFSMGYPHIKNFKHIRLALGFHPLMAKDNEKEMNLFRQYIDYTSYIGEIGLDFSTIGYKTKMEQINLIRSVFSILKGKNKIISVHSRRAERELLDLLEEFDIKNVIFHWYSGPIYLISKIIDKGYYFSINEAMTISEHGKKIIATIPTDKILTESDAPYNKHTSIHEVLSYTRLSEKDIKTNFFRLIENIK